MTAASAVTAGGGSVAHEAARRRTFAIISHPDAGKTTLTEKLQASRWTGSEREFGATVALDPTPWTVARRTDTSGTEQLRRTGQGDVLFRTDGPLAVFMSEWRLERFARDHPDVTLDRLLTR